MERRSFSTAGRSFASVGETACMNVPGALAASVHERAQGRCEYCGMSQTLQGATFHVEHITPRTCGGTTALENLALACPSCNLRKSDRSHVMDQMTGTMQRLFNPRSDLWREHFAWVQFALNGLTPVGRATVQALDMNHPRRLRIREAEARFGLFPQHIPA
jgi:hypothetical protein